MEGAGRVLPSCTSSPIFSQDMVLNVKSGIFNEAPQRQVMLRNNPVKSKVKESFLVAKRASLGRVLMPLGSFQRVPDMDSRACLGLEQI